MSNTWNHKDDLMKLRVVLVFMCRGRDSSDGIATRYGLGGPAIESR